MAMKKKPQKDTEVEAPAAMAALFFVNPVFARAWTDMVSSSARFMTDRLQTDLETQKALLACKTPAELMAVQAQFLNTTMQQYANEAARVFDITLKVSADLSEDLKSGHARDYDDVPV
ncbi:MAG: phasin family protein [Dinoroseobacter sp.]|nr:phasin family protein [Dinoroseobacter sp.]